MNDRQQTIYPMRILTETDYKNEAVKHGFQNTVDLAKERVKIKKILRMYRIKFDNQDALSHLRNLLNNCTNSNSRIEVQLTNGSYEWVSIDDLEAAANHYDRMVAS